MIFLQTKKYHPFLEWYLYSSVLLVRTDSSMAPPVGLEPTTYRLTAERSTNWAIGEYIKSSNNLFSQQGNPQVFLALFCLTSVFGMGTGITKIVIVTRKLITCFYILYYITLFTFLQYFIQNFLIFFESTLKNT